MFILSSVTMYNYSYCMLYLTNISTKMKTNYHLSHTSKRSHNKDTPLTATATSTQYIRSDI